MTVHKSNLCTYEHRAFNKKETAISHIFSGLDKSYF